MRNQTISLHRNFLMEDEQEYKVIKKLVNGDFNVPVSERTLKKSEIKKIGTKTFVKNKSGGHCKIQERAGDGMAGVNKSEVLKVINNDGKFRFNASFTNKAKKVYVFYGYIENIDFALIYDLKNLCKCRNFGADLQGKNKSILPGLYLAVLGVSRQPPGQIFPASKFLRKRYLLLTTILNRLYLHFFNILVTQSTFKSHQF